MEVLQYIYTSWKNGDSTEKGYMIYSKSQGITEAECIAIKDAMQYVAPKELNLAPTAEEIAEVFPYAFSYFILPPLPLLHLPHHLPLLALARIPQMFLEP